MKYYISSFIIIIIISVEMKKKYISDKKE